MLSIGDTRAKAVLEMAKLFGREYIKANFKRACTAYPESEEVLYEYFCGFECDEDTNKWIVFARVLVNRESGEATFLDYKLPNGERMAKPIKPVRFA